MVFVSTAPSFAKMTERTRQAKNESRNKRKNLLSNLAKIRSGEASRSETLEIKNEENVFDMVDEDEYQKIVEDRRKNTDFVVDDGVCTASRVFNYFSQSTSHVFFTLSCVFLHVCVFQENLGYYDDGEEHLGVGESKYDGK